VKKYQEIDTNEENNRNIAAEPAIQYGSDKNKYLSIQTHQKG